MTNDNTPAIQTHEVGARVNWMHSAVGGYGYAVPIEAVVLKLGAKRVQIRFAERFAGTWHTETRWVSPKTLTPRTKHVPEVDGYPSITRTQGDILASKSEAIVNPVNCVGVMGRGLALQFKNAHPANFLAYEAACVRKIVQPGHMFVFETGLEAPRFIINFPTKRHWRDPSHIEDIESGLADLVQVIAAKAIRSIAVPPLGCGLGGLDWKDVRPLIESALGVLPGVQVTIHELIEVIR